MTNQTNKLRRQFETAKILSTAKPKRRKSWQQANLPVTFMPEPESFLSMTKRTGRQYNGATAGRF